MQKIILDTIEEFERWFVSLPIYTQNTKDFEMANEVSLLPIKFKKFLKQALTNAFEAGQKSREKERETIIETGNGRFGIAYPIHFIEGYERAKDEITKSLSLTKESTK